MVSKSKMELKLNFVLSDEHKEIDGISFSNICYIEIILDGKNILNNDLFYGSFVYFKELKKSTVKSGNYLIFTAVSGIADDLGWDYIIVNHVDNNIIWKFERDELKLSYIFDKKEYLMEIDKLERMINDVDKSIIFEPANVVYPE